MLRIALAGLGTVGAGAVRLLQKNADVITARGGQELRVTAVSARDKNRKRACDIASATWFDNPLKLAGLPDIDVVVELIGGGDGVAYELAEAALKNGKHFVTANKALIAKHGAALARLAEAHNVQLLFEASVAGGIPVIKTLREGLAGNRINVVRGILNGTCNYILTRMRDEKMSFADALAEAQAKGFAEADPSADIDGHDTANKLVILAALAFGGEPSLQGVAVEGIRHITALDLKFAEELGCRIKLLGVARKSEAGVEQLVGPCLVPATSSLASVQGVMNAVLFQGDFIGNLTLGGPGAGAEPTASAVVADLIDIARGASLPAFGVPAEKLTTLQPAAASEANRYYMRLQVVDKPGVMAEIASVLRDEGVSVESLLQHGTSATESVPLVITTHAVDSAPFRRAVEKIAKLPAVAAPLCVLRIEG